MRDRVRDHAITLDQRRTHTHTHATISNEYQRDQQIATVGRDA